MEYNHTKVDQWMAFVDIYKKHEEVTIDCSMEDDISLLGIQQSLDYWTGEISFQSSPPSFNIPLNICHNAHLLYCNLIGVYVDFDEYAERVALHIESYVEPQYGNFPDKTIAKFNPIKIQGKLEAYTDRIGKSSRGKEDEIRDALKIGHFSCYLYSLITNNGDAQAMPKEI